MRKTLSLLALTGLVVALPALAHNHTESGAGTIKGNDGSVLGHVTAQAAPKGVLLRVDLKGLTPGWHGIHFHAKGDCGDQEKFLNSGAHVHHHGLEKATHGLLNPEANDSGDLPNIFVHADGTAQVELFSTFVTYDPVEGDSRPALKDADGSALVIHANPDDHTTQPIGGAGARVACAVIP